MQAIVAYSHSGPSYYQIVDGRRVAFSAAGNVLIRKPTFTGNGEVRGEFLEQTILGNWSAMNRDQLAYDVSGQRWKYFEYVPGSHYPWREHQNAPENVELALIYGQTVYIMAKDSDNAG